MQTRVRTTCRRSRHTFSRTNEAPHARGSSNPPSFSPSCKSFKKIIRGGGRACACVCMVFSCTRAGGRVCAGRCRSLPVFAVRQTFEIRAHTESATPTWWRLSLRSHNAIVFRLSVQSSRLQFLLCARWRHPSVGGSCPRFLRAHTLLFILVLAHSSHLISSPCNPEQRSIIILNKIDPS